MRLNTSLVGTLCALPDAAAPASPHRLAAARPASSGSLAGLRRAWSGLGWSGIWLVLPALALLLAGGLLRDHTQAFFTNTATVTDNSFTSALVGLNSPSITAFSVSNLVPGDFRSTTGTITNSSNVAVTYFLTTWADTSTALDSNTAGLQLAVFRCGTLSAPTPCASATTFETITGLMDQAATVRVTTSGGPPNASGTAVSGTSLQFATGGSSNVTVGDTVTGVPVLTKNAPNTQGRCTTSTDGACPLGGYGSQTESSPSVAVTSGSHTVTMPAVTSGDGLGANGGGSDTDYILIYAFLPTTVGTTYQSLSSSLSFAFTAVQPSGRTTGTGGAVHG
jgi:hypothetical protein